jgi:hypothetical protein
MNLLRFVILHVLLSPLKPLYAAPLRELDYLFGQFFTLLHLLELLFFEFGLIVEKPIAFRFFEHLYQFLNLIRH